MKMRREWWYVVVLVVLILIVIIFFRDEVGFAPAKGSADNSVMKDVGFVQGGEKFSKTQIANSQELVDELKKLGATDE